MNKEDQELFNAVLARRQAIEGVEQAYQLAEAQEDAFGQIEALRIHESILGKKSPKIEPIFNEATKMWSVVVPSGFPNSTRGAQVFHSLSLEGLVSALGQAQYHATGHIIRQQRSLKENLGFRTPVVVEALGPVGY